MKILAIVAHPDDEVLACGGTLRLLANEGHEITIAILGEGITSRYKERANAESPLLEDLHVSAEKVSLMLGASRLILEKLPDNRFDTIPTLDVVKIIEALVVEVRPHTIYTHHAGDLNVDHRVVHRAVLTATRPIAGHVVRDIYACEIASSTEWSFQRFDPIFRPNVFVDISETLEVKLAAMEVYTSEKRPFPHPRSPEALRATAMRWAAATGCMAAEAFELIRSLR
jgi:LmbE family N-acetylglucosaminyl deacetylase